MQLRLLRGQVDDWMHSRSTLLGDKAEAGTAKDFLLLLRASSADSVVLLDAHGRASYPTLPAPPTMDAVAGGFAWRAARALEIQHNFDNAAAEFSRLAASAQEPSLYARAVQSEIRCLVRGGHKKEAVTTILSRFSGERAMKATDLRGRLILADEELFGLQLMRRSDPRFLDVADRLAKLLNDYSSVTMPSSQRLFLMSELKALVPDRVVFPSLAAEELAAQYLEAEDRNPGTATLEPTRIRDLWSITSSNGRVVAIYRTSTMVASINHLLEDQNSSSGARFFVTPPGLSPPGEAIAAGPALPGWQIAYSYVDAKAMERAASSRLATYLWVGYLVIAAVAFTGILLGYSFRRRIG